VNHLLLRANTKSAAFTFVELCTSDKCAKYTSAFSYQWNIELIASDNSVDAASVDPDVVQFRNDASPVWMSWNVTFSRPQV